MDKIDEVKLTVVEAKAPSLDIDTRTFVVKPSSMYKWSLHNGSYLVMEPRYNQHDMLYLNPMLNFALVMDMYGKRCLKITAKVTE